MKVISLSTEQAPLISIPLRFFITAPLFLLLAGIILVSGTGNPFASIHTPALLAATHCITLGFMSMIMLGATHQILPVVVGRPMPISWLTAWLTFIPLALGALLLSAGLMLSKPVWLNLAWPLLGLAFITFISASLMSLAQAPARNHTKTAILLSILALAGTIALGMLLAHGHANGFLLPYAKLATAHIGLSLGGWIMLLIVGVSYQVVPMFQITPNYPEWLGIFLAPALFIVLLLSLLPLMPNSEQHRVTIFAQTLFWFLASSFAVTTLILQSKRRRRVADATLSFFRLGMVSLICAAMFGLAPLFFPDIDHLAMLSAVLFLLGFAMSLMHGMLYKIVPFLVWFHLFRCGVKISVPNMKEIIAEKWMWRHLWLHCSTLIAAIFSLWWDMAVWLVSLGLLLQSIILGYSLVTAILLYKHILKRIEVI